MSVQVPRAQGEGPAASPLWQSASWAHRGQASGLHAVQPCQNLPRRQLGDESSTVMVEMYKRSLLQTFIASKIRA